MGSVSGVTSPTGGMLARFLSLCSYCSIGFFPLPPRLATPDAPVLFFRFNHVPWLEWRLNITPNADRMKRNGLSVGISRGRQDRVPNRWTAISFSSRRKGGAGVLASDTRVVVV